VAVEFPRKGLASNRVFWREVHAVEFGGGIELPFPSRAVEWLMTTRPCTALKVRAASALLPTLFPSSTGSRLSPSSSHEPSMKWLSPVDRTSGMLTLSAGTLSCLAHHGTPLSERCPTTTALERTTVPMDTADRMLRLGAVKPRQKSFDDIHRGCSPLERGT
jgi:hypothetical protein